ncbi:MAG: M20/M25/M40 family metallo-hydrolase, partial [Flavobacteriaceae bacterium]|nr:M20/M25/M40 family metallo-hydrolase [Flavobacteriaceae bacterium]
MKDEILQLSPQRLWHHFYQLNQVPRGSKKEEKVIAFMVDFGNSLGLETLVDATQNVLIRKPATPGMENRKAIILQSHLDMVHQKNANTNFDFDTQAIEMYVDGDWVKAKGTTLGADNGLGVAAIMSVLEATDIAHPALEALFTIDEETGMTGAKGLQANFLQGAILLNLDTENDSEIDVGCAGGIDVSARKSYVEVGVNQDFTALNIVVNGLKGGHSGMDIHKGLGNANKILNRLFFDLLPFNYSIVEI